jgi:peptide/nickel transport system substrate-binding protein
MRQNFLPRFFRGAIVATASLLVAAAPVMAESVTIVLDTEPDQLDPCQAAKSQVGKVIKQNVIETLTEVNPADGSVAPRLATSWEQIDDLTWRFELREGVTFHDGSPLNAEAVAFSLERTLVESLACEAAIKYFTGMDVQATVVDDTTIDFVTAAPSPIMPTLMGSLGIMGVATPMDTITRDPIGTGPFMLSEWTPGQQIVLSPFDAYWGETPAVTAATYVWRPDSAVRAAMVAAGEADIAPTIAVQDATDPAMDFSYINSDTSSFRIDAAVPPLDDIRVRRALNYAIDREAMQGSIFSDGVIPASQLVVPGINGHNPDLTPFPYDPEMAMALLDEARADGVPVDTEIVLIGRFNIYPNSEEAIQAVMAMYQAVGLNVSLRMTEAAEWFELAFKPFPEDRAPNIFQTSHDNNNGDAVFTIGGKYLSSSDQSTIAVPELDALIDKASAATGDERRETFEEAFRMIHEDIVPDVGFFHMVGFTRVNPRLDFEPSIATNSELQLSQIAFN